MRGALSYLQFFHDLSFLPSYRGDNRRMLDLCAAS